MSAVEATLNGKLLAMDQKLDSIGSGVRIANDCNLHIVRVLGEIRAEHGLYPDTALHKAADTGRDWNEGEGK